MPRLDEVADIFGGYSFKSSDLGSVGVAVVKIADISPPLVSIASCQRVVPSKTVDLSRYLLKDRDIVMAMTGATTGKVGRYRGVESAYLNQRVAKLTAKQGPEFDDYVYAIVSQPGFEEKVLNNASGSAQPNVSAEGIGRIEVAALSRADQLAVGRTIAALDDKIDLNRKTSATLEAIARALFKSWFVDFDPVHAKAEGRDPGLPAEIAALFPHSFEETAHGEIPEGWHTGTAAELFSLQNGYAFRSKDWLEAGVPVVKIGSVKPGLVDLKAVSYVSEDVAEEASRFRLRVGDMLIGMTGYVGEVGLVPPTSNPPLLNQRVGKISPRDCSGTVSPFAYSFFRLPETKSFIETKSQGSAQANVSSEGILSSPVTVSPTSLRHEYDKICGPMIARMVNGYGEISTLGALRDALLPKLISGEVRVGDAERVLAASA